MFQDNFCFTGDAPADERCHGSHAQYRAVKRQGSVDSDVGKLHRSAVVKCCRGQQSTEELMKEPNNSYQVYNTHPYRSCMESDVVYWVPADLPL